MAELLKAYESDIGSVTLVPSEGGRFELTVNGKLLYSKLQTGRHSEPGEVLGLVKQFLMEDE
jgi:selenoprotein W-related protein